MICLSTAALKRFDSPQRFELLVKNGLAIILFFVGFWLLIGVLSVLRPNLFVRRRSGFGYTLDFRNPWSWVVHLYLLIGLPLLLIFLALSRSPW
jgi:hypothetical protein